jgi:hypothetical protein
MTPHPSIEQLSSGKTATMQPLTIDSWTQFAELLERYLDGAWLFRGETDGGFELKPAAGRVGREFGSARKKPYRNNTRLMPSNSLKGGHAHD